MTARKLSRLLPPLTLTLLTCASCWLVPTGSTGTDRALAVDLDGQETLVVGTFEGTVEFGDFELEAPFSGTPACYAARIDDNGEYVWATRISDYTFESELGDIKLHPNGDVYAACGIGSRARLVRLDAESGDIFDIYDKPGQSASVFYSIAHRPYHAIAIGPEGEVYAAGDSTISVLKSNFQFELTYYTGVDRYDADIDLGVEDFMGFGNYKPAQNPEHITRINAIDTTSTGSVVIGGEFRGAFEFGDQSFVSENSTNAFLMHLDSDLDLILGRNYGNQDFDDAVVDLEVAEDDSVYVGGNFEGIITFLGGAWLNGNCTDVLENNMFVVHYKDLNLYSEVWSHSFGSCDASELSALDYDGAFVHLAGSFEGDLDILGEPLASEGAQDMAYIRLNPDAVGSLNKARAGGGSGDDVAYDVGRVIVAGSFEDQASFPIDNGVQSVQADGAEPDALIWNAY